MIRRHAVAALAAVLALPVPEAWACSCLPPQAPAAVLAGEGVKIVRGRVIAAVPEPDTWSVRYEIAVRDRVNLGPGDRLEVRTANQSAACGVALRPGEEAVLRLEGEGPVWGINICAQLSLGDPDWDAFFRLHGE